MNIIPFDKLFFHTADFGSHSVAKRELARTRDDCFARVFDIPNLDLISVAELAQKVKAAIDGAKPNSHKAWPAQERYLQGFLQLGPPGIYGACTFKLRPGRRNGTIVLSDGGHRALALCLLDEHGFDLDKAKLNTNGPESLGKGDAIAILTSSSG